MDNPKHFMFWPGDECVMSPADTNSFTPVLTRP